MCYCVRDGYYQSYPKHLCSIVPDLEWSVSEAYHWCPLCGDLQTWYCTDLGSKGGSAFPPPKSEEVCIEHRWEFVVHARIFRGPQYTKDISFHWCPVCGSIERTESKNQDGDIETKEEVRIPLRLQKNG